MIAGSIATVEYRRPRASPLRYVPMPATPADIQELRGLLYFLENPDKYTDAITRRKQIDALRRALQVLEYGDPASPLWWVAGALRKAVRKVSPRMYVTVDRSLETWAFDELFRMFPEDDTDARN
jgi:hypothetical protein